MLNRTGVLLLTAATAATWWTDVLAREGIGSGATVDELIVTARRREESLQAVPVSAVVIDAEKIERLVLSSPRDLIAQTPGVTMAANTAGAVVSDDIVIRGVGVARLDSSGSPTGIFRDGLFIGNGTFFGKSFTQFDMFDIRRFEVFRGPQGALWGRQAAGGAVAITTAEPKFAFSGRLKAGFEVEQDARKLEGVVNIPLGDTLAIRLGGQYDDRDGGQIRIKDPTSPLNGRALDKSRWAGVRGAVRWRPTAEMDHRLTVEYLETDNPSYAIYFARPGRGDPGRFDRACTVQLPTSRFLPSQFCKFNDADQQSHTDMWQAFYRGQWKLGFGTLQLSAIYTDRHTVVDDEWDTYTHALVGPTLGLSPAGALLFGAGIGARGVGPTDTSLYPRYGDFEKTGAELLFTSRAEGRFTWLAGADVYRTDDVSNQANIIQYRNPSMQAGPLPPGALLANQSLDQTNRREGVSWSVFGSVGFEIVENLTLSAEGRYTVNDIDNSARNIVLFTCPDVAPVPTNCAPGRVLSRSDAILPKTRIKEEIFTPVVSAIYRVVPGHSVYVRYAEGFRPAGYDTRNAGAVFFGRYDAERLKSYEAGYKGQAFAGHMTFALAGYRNRHRDFQIQDVFVGDDGLVRTKIGNAPRADSWGVEASTRARFQAAGGAVSLGVAYAWTDGTIKPYQVPAGAVTVASVFSNRRLSDTRDYQVVADAGFDAPIGGWNGAAWSIDVSYRLEGGGFQNPQNTLPLADVRILDGAVGLRQGAWRLRVYGRNLTNEIHVVQDIPGVFPEGALKIYNQPRTWGLELTRTW